MYIYSVSFELVPDNELRNSLVFQVLIKTGYYRVHYLSFSASVSIYFYTYLSTHIFLNLLHIFPGGHLQFPIQFRVTLKGVICPL